MPAASWGQSGLELHGRFSRCPRLGSPLLPTQQPVPLLHVALRGTSG